MNTFRPASKAAVYAALVVLVLSVMSTLCWIRSIYFKDELRMHLFGRMHAIHSIEGSVVWSSWNGRLQPFSTSYQAVGLPEPAADIVRRFPAALDRDEKYTKFKILLGVGDREPICFRQLQISYAYLSWCSGAFAAGLIARMVWLCKM